MGLNTTQCAMWAIGSTAITAIQMLHQDWLIRGLSGEHRTAYAVKQCEICSLTKCCGRNSWLSSPSTMGFGKDPQQRWVMESSRPSGRNSPQSSSARSCSSSWISRIKDSILICCGSDFCSSHVFRFHAQQSGAAQHCHPLCLQQADHWLWWFCGLYDPLRDPVQ